MYRALMLLLAGVSASTGTFAQFSGGSGRGEHAAVPAAITASSALFAGGVGSGNGAWMPDAPIAPVSIYSGGPGSGDDAQLPPALLAPTAIFNGGNGRGDLADVPAPLLATMAIHSGGSGCGDAAFLPVPLLTPLAIYGGAPGRGDVAHLPAPITVPLAIFSGGSGRGDHRTLVLLPRDLQLFARALLEGPYDGFFAMHDSLRRHGLVPLEEPYTALGYAHVGGGGETTSPEVLAFMPNGNVVDWVVLELRNTADPAQVMATRSALILENGQIVDTDGIGPVIFNDQLPGDYYVAIRHRNHLGAMHLWPASLSTTASFVDFAQPSSMMYGIEARKYSYPNMLLWAGDVSHDGELKYVGENNDRDPILVRIGGTVPTATTTGYLQEDVNMDGQVKYVGERNDRDPILVNIGGSVPTNTRQEQLP